MTTISNTANEVKQTNTRPLIQDRTFILEETDMEDDMVMTALEIVEKNKQLNNQELCQKFKEEFENKYYPTWICIVGKSFGCKVNAQKKHYLCLQYEKKIIIIYKYH
jgi:dynein light chain LC8-type